MSDIVFHSKDMRITSTVPWEDALVSDYLRMSGDVSVMHSVDACLDFFDDHPEFTNSLKFVPTDAIVPGLIVLAPVIGMFRNQCGFSDGDTFNGFLLGSLDGVKFLAPTLRAERVWYYAEKFVKTGIITGRGHHGYRFIGYAETRQKERRTTVLKFDIQGFIHESFPLPEGDK